MQILSLPPDFHDKHRKRELFCHHCDCLVSKLTFYDCHREEFYGLIEKYGIATTYCTSSRSTMSFAFKLRIFTKQNPEQYFAW